MTDDTFTRDGSRIVICPGKGAWVREFDWSGWGNVWTADIDDVCYTLTIADLPSNGDWLPHLLVTLEARRVGPQQAVHAVLIVSQSRPVAAMVDTPSLLESASTSIRIAHHWVEIILRVSAPMTRDQALDLHLVDLDQALACLSCPPVGLVPA